MSRISQPGLMSLVTSNTPIFSENNHAPPHPHPLPDPSPVNNQRHIYARSDERSLPSEPTAGPFSCKYMSPSGGRAARGQALAPPSLTRAVPSPRGLSSRPLAGTPFLGPSSDLGLHVGRAANQRPRTNELEARRPRPKAESIRLFMSAAKSEQRRPQCVCAQAERKLGAGRWESAKGPAAERRGLPPAAVHIKQNAGVYFRRRLTLDTEPG